MIIYGIKSCDTCRKARKALPLAQFHDTRDLPLSAADLSEFWDHFGDTLINRASTTWRGLSDHEKTLPPLDLLAQYPTLMKRPVIRMGDTLHLGWKADVQRAVGVA